MEQQKQKKQFLATVEAQRDPIFLHILFIFSAPRLTSTIAGFLHKRHWRFVAQVCFQLLLKGGNLTPPQHISSTGYSARLVNWKLCVFVYIFLLTFTFFFFLLAIISARLVRESALRRLNNSLSSGEWDSLLRAVTLAGPVLLSCTQARAILVGATRKAERWHVFKYWMSEQESESGVFKKMQKECWFNGL